MDKRVLLIGLQKSFMVNAIVIGLQKSDYQVETVEPLHSAIEAGDGNRRLNSYALFGRFFFNHPANSANMLR